MEEAAMDDRVHPETIDVLIEMLLDELRLRGLSAEAFGANMVRAANRAAEPSHDDPRATLSPGLRQTLICRPDEENRPGWWWIWIGSDGDPEYEWLCPGVQPGTAADAVARVLAVRPDNDLDERVGGSA
jgi:hypothetical protein